MRKLMWFTIGFAAACCVGAYAMPGRGMIWLAAGCLAGFAAFLFLPKGRLMAVLALGCAVGACWFAAFDAVQLEPLRVLDGQTVSISGEVTNYGYETDYGSPADVITVLNGKRCLVRLYTKFQEPLWPGDRVTGPVYLYLTTEGEESNFYQPADGIFLRAYPAGELTAQRAQSVPARYFPAVLRANLQTFLTAAFPEDTAAFARALLLGDSRSLSYAQDTAFKVSGIRHVIAVSGLHVSILFSLIYILAGKRPGLTALLGIPALLLFAAVAGFTPSITRACIMQILVILAMLLRREYDPPTALSLAALIMLAVNPMVIASVSFQLSAGCMIGIFLLYGRISGYLMRHLAPKKKRSALSAIVTWSVGSVSVALSAMAVTTPLCAWYFGAVSLVGVLTNLLTLWVISFLFYGVVLSCLVGALYFPAGRLVAWLIAWPIRYVLGVSRAMASLPWASVYTCSVYIVLWLALCYGLLLVFFCCRKRRPGVLFACAALGLSLAIAASCLEPRMDHFRATVLNVGQGQCILLQSGDSYYLVDCGGGTGEGAADRAAEILLSQGVRRLDGIILTHFDRDHAGGVAALLTRIGAEALYVPINDGDSAISRTLAASREMCRIERKTVFACGEARITLFPGNPEKSENESGLCVLFQAENCDILITGDRNLPGEAQLLAQGPLPKLEVLVVGHHGADDATGLALLKQTQPDVAVVSVGLNNAYGHPTQPVLNRLALFGCQVLRTDLEGNILIRG